jgi:hypothetical protein
MNNDRNRDQYGRFTDDDNSRRGNQGRENFGHGRSGSQNRERDDQGRFMSNDDDQRFSSQGGQRGNNQGDYNEGR